MGLMPAQGKKKKIMGNLVNCSRLISGDVIHGVTLTRISELTDVRGSFSEIFRNDWGAVIEPVQFSLVKSKKDALRGMHFHRRHDEYFCLSAGHCLLALRDIRCNSATKGLFSLYEFFGSDLVALTFPRGLVHGWYFYEDSVHIQAVSESYSDYCKDDNLGVFWNDPHLGIPWPDINPILSERAASFSSLECLINSTLPENQTI
jgi:dTDP-4-dehydrorhamnose 3,5-epimerase